MLNRHLAVLISAACLTACVGLGPVDDASRQSERVVADVMALNDAHAEAQNAIMMVNILRSRDRVPTNYMTISGIQSSPSLKFSAGGSFSPLGLGNAPSAFQGSSGSLSRDQGSSATFTLNPFATEKDQQSLYEPIPLKALAQFWSDGFPQDILLLLFAEYIEIEGRSGRIHNSANMSCLTVTPAQAMGNDRRLYSSGRASMSESWQDCYPAIIDVLTKGRADGDVQLSQDESVLTVTARNGQRLRIHNTDMRSFDGVIYYLGQMLREQRTETAAVVHGPYCPAIDANAAASPLIRITDNPRGNAYAVKARYAGKTVYAAPRFDGRSCPADRTGLVLSALNQVYRLSQSSDFLKAPQNNTN